MSLGPTGVRRPSGTTNSSLSVLPSTTCEIDDEVKEAVTIPTPFLFQDSHLASPSSA
jgi:hypothetical protein